MTRVTGTPRVTRATAVSRVAQVSRVTRVGPFVPSIRLLFAYRFRGGVCLMRRLFRTETVVVVLSLMMWIVSSEPAHAQGPGVRAGVSVVPDQFYFGGHYETGELIDRLHFRPNLEVGVGDDVTTVAANIEVVYKIPVKKRRGTSFYLGGGPAINWYDTEDNS